MNVLTTPRKLSSLVLLCAMCWGVQAQAQSRPTAHRSYFDDFVPNRSAAPSYLVPSLGIYLAWRDDEHDMSDETTLSVNFWAGLTLHPWADTFNAFVSGGVEVEPTTLPDGRDATYFMPMLRVGYAWQATCWGSKVEVNYLTSTFPCLTVYTLLGVRPGTPNAPEPSIRAGLGINSPFLTAIFGAAELLIPSSYEGLVEVGPDGIPSYTFRLGLMF